MTKASRRLEGALNAPATPGEGPGQVDRAAVAARAEDAFAVSRAAKARLKALRDGPTGVSTIEKDAEVAAFLRKRFKSRMTLAQLRASCVERFGEGRSPSAGRIGIFRQRVRT